MTAITIFLDPGPYFREAIDSVLAQSYPELEYLLVDDGSTDGSSALAKEVAAAHPERVRYLEHDGHANLGMSRSRNVGLAEARGELVAFLDADDVWLPQAVERQVTYLDAHPTAQMVIGATLLWSSWGPAGGRDRVRTLERRGMVEPPHLALERIRQRRVSPSMNTLLARRSAIAKVGGFEEGFAGLFEDQAFLLKFLLEHHVVVHDDVVDRYRQHPASATARADTVPGHDPAASARHARAFARFACHHIAAGPWRGSRVHLEAVAFHRVPRLSRSLYRFRPGLYGRIVASLARKSIMGRSNLAQPRPRQALRSLARRVRPYLLASSVTRPTRIGLIAVEFRRAVTGGSHRDVRLRLEHGGVAYARTDTLAIDMETLEYAIRARYFPADARGRVVLDLGAHKGYVALSCLERGSTAVYSLEPESNNFRCMQRSRPAAATSGRWYRERLAVGASAGRAQLQVSSESWSHSLYAPPSGDTLRTEDVEVVAFGDLLARAERENPGAELVVKLNVEGMAGDCLLSVGPERFEAVHELFVDIESSTPQPFELISDHLAAAGFEPRSERDGVWHFVRPGAEAPEEVVADLPTFGADRGGTARSAPRAGRQLARAIGRRTVPARVRRWRADRATPPPGKVRFGDLRRTAPLNRDWGYNRGGPVDRHYIEAFLERHSDDIRGRVLEIADDTYTRRFGGEQVTQADVLHVSPDAPGATFVGDLADGGFLPDDAFDAIVLTQTLHLIFDFSSALRTLHRVLKPGGVLLLTVPGITPVDRGEWGSSWYYSFTDHALARMFERSMPGVEAEIGSHGNALTAVGFLHGLGAGEFTRAELDASEPTHSIVHTARVHRPVAS